MVLLNAGVGMASHGGRSAPSNERDARNKILSSALPSPAVEQPSRAKMSTASSGTPVAAIPSTSGTIADRKSKVNSHHRSSSISNFAPLRRQLSMKKEFMDLMNDWEIGGTQNPWVCPSDRHLQLRAQLKSGWSVRTATARSPTNARQAGGGSSGVTNVNSGQGVGGAVGSSSTSATNGAMSGCAITDDEQEHIRRVLARAERGRMNEEMRIGKMVDRLEKLRSHATGNGVTQCLLCQTEFGLLASKSYAAMCLNCRKYVCQRNCGVETFDQKRGEPIFLCKICSEYREVMWKKSGAWFYREMPNYQRPSLMDGNFSDSVLQSSTAPCNGGSPSTRHRNEVLSRRTRTFGKPEPSSCGGSPAESPRRFHHNYPSAGRNAFYAGSDGSGARHSNDSGKSATFGGANNGDASFFDDVPPSNYFPFYNPVSVRPTQHDTSVQRQLSQELQQRLKMRPRPRITPSWVHEKVQSSISVGSDCEDDEEDEEDEEDIDEDISQVNTTRPYDGYDEEDDRENAAIKSRGESSSALLKRASPSSSSSSMTAGAPVSSQQQQIITGTTPALHLTKRNTRHPEMVDSNTSIGAMRFGGRDSESGSVASLNALPHTQTNIGDLRMRNASTTTQKSRYHSRHNNQLQQGGNSSQYRQINFSAQRYLSNDDSNNNEESDNDESRRSTPSTSPRHSIATPSSYGGDDISASQITLPNSERASSSNGATTSTFAGGQNAIASTSTIAITATDNTTADTKSIDSGVVQSDHSVHHAHLDPQLAAQAAASQSIIANNYYTNKKRQQHQLQNTEISSTAACTTVSPSSFPVMIPPPIPPRVGAALPPPTTIATFTLAESDEHYSSTNTRFQRTSGATKGGYNVESRVSSRESLESSRTDLRVSPMSTALNHLNYHHSSSRPNSASSDFLAASISRECLEAAVGNATPCFSASKKDEYNATHLSSSEEPDMPTFVNRPDDAMDSNTLGFIQFNVTYLPEEQQLIVYLIRAKGLKAMDKNGFSDPYVKLHLIPGNTKATKLTSRTIEKTLNPEWHEELIYHGVTEDDRQRKFLRLTVLDRDRISSDFLGETRVALKNLPQGHTKKFSLYLEHALPTPVKKTEKLERGKILISVCYNIQQGSLFVNIKRCAELLGMDSTGFSDPYCKVSLTPLMSKSHRQKTSIKKRTLNPEFNTQLQFIVPFKDLPKKTLEIGVYDYDVGRHDDYIGGILLSTTAKDLRGKQWRDCIQNPGKTFEYWHKLELDN